MWVGAFIKTQTRCICLSWARGRNQRPVHNLYNASVTDCPPSAAYLSYKNTTRIQKLGSAKLLPTNTQSNRIAELFTLSVRWLNEGVLPVVFLKAANLCSGENNFNATLLPDCVAHHCTMCILSSTMALWSKAEIQKYTFWWEKNIFEAIFPMLF